MMILAIFAMSLDLLLGVTGLVSLGHAALLRPGRLRAGLSHAGGRAGQPVVDAAGGRAASALAALVIGFFVVRTHGIYFIMVTMAFAQMVFFLFFDNKVLGGSDGLYINFKPDAPACSTWRTSGSSTTSRWRPAAASTLFLRRLLWSPFGRALAGIRVNEHRMRAMGLRHLRLQARGLHAGRRAGRAWPATCGARRPATSTPS